MDELTGKVAVVTGGASGIGLAMTRAFLDEGMKVVVADIEADALADAMARVLGDPALAAQLSANGHALIQNKFSWAAIAQDYETVYAEALQNARGSP
mgnify:CR=1 FL=1